jgi:hypothetical protein
MQRGPKFGWLLLGESLNSQCGELFIWRRALLEYSLYGRCKAMERNLIFASQPEPTSFFPISSHHSSEGWLLLAAANSQAMLRAGSMAGSY